MTRLLYTALFSAVILLSGTGLVDAQTKKVIHVSEDHNISPEGVVTTTRNVSTLGTNPQDNRFIMYDDIKEPLLADNDIMAPTETGGSTYTVQERKVLHYYNPDGSERVIVDNVEQRMHHAQ